MTPMTTADPAPPPPPAGPPVGPQAGPRTGPRARTRLRRWAAGAVRWIRSAPGTYVWLLILGANTFALVHMSPRMRKYFLFTHSTNLEQLRHHPIKVLITSAFWTETPSFLFWFLVFNLFSVPVERWLGTRRWLAVVAIAHVGATLVSQGTVNVLINAGVMSRHNAFVLDIGVSYAVSGAVGMLTWFLARPLRWYYLGGAAAFYAYLLISDSDFTNLGHLTAFLIGLGCYPLGRGVPGGDWRPRRWRDRHGDSTEKLSPLRSGATG